MPWHDVGQDARNNVGGDIGAMFGMMTGTMLGKQSNTKKYRVITTRIHL